jgi:3',5'-cyclic-AMP phosphodiesterase
VKLLHITDTHVVSPGAKLYGLDPVARLDAAIADINRHHADASIAVVTGDLTHWGEPAAYQAFAASMARLSVPYVALVGNHDRRQNCLAGLEHAPRDAGGFVQGARTTPFGTLIFLDTLDETSHAGEMCGKRLTWLAETLRQLPSDVPVFIFMHHPPFPVGIQAMDEIALIQRAEFAAVIKPYTARIRHLFFGHVHRPMSGSWHGIPFSTLRGTNHQVWFDLDPASDHLASHEPPAYGVVLISQDTVVVHTHDFLDQSLRFPFSKSGLDERAYVLGDFPG